MRRVNMSSLVLMITLAQWAGLPFSAAALAECTHDKAGHCEHCPHKDQANCHKDCKSGKCKHEGKGHAHAKAEKSADHAHAEKAADPAAATPAGEPAAH